MERTTQVEIARRAGTSSKAIKLIIDAIIDELVLGREVHLSGSHGSFGKFFLTDIHEYTFNRAEKLGGGIIVVPAHRRLYWAGTSATSNEINKRIRARSIAIEDNHDTNP